LRNVLQDVYPQRQFTRSELLHYALNFVHPLLVPPRVLATELAALFPLPEQGPVSSFRHSRRDASAASNR